MRLKKRTIGAVFRESIGKTAGPQETFETHPWKTRCSGSSLFYIRSGRSELVDSFRRIIPLNDPPAREHYDCEEPEALSPFPSWDFAPKAGIGSFSGYRYASGARIYSKNQAGCPA